MAVYEWDCPTDGCGQKVRVDTEDDQYQTVGAAFARDVPEQEIIYARCSRNHRNRFVITGHG